MAIDYIICKSCPIKEKYGDKELIVLVKKHGMALSLLKRHMDEGMSHEEAVEQTFMAPVRRGDGSLANQEVQILDLLAETEVLKKYKNHCRECPVSRDYDFGCYQIVNYPISGKAEEWLSEMARAARKKGAPFNRLIYYIREEGISGAIFAGLRKQSEQQFLEREECIPVATSLGVVNTDQILEAFFTISPLNESLIAYILFFSGCLSIEAEAPPEGSYDHAVKIRNSDGRVDYWVLKFPVIKEKDKSIEALQRYIESLFLAFSVKEQILVDF